MTKRDEEQGADVASASEASDGIPTHEGVGYQWWWLGWKEPVDVPDESARFRRTWPLVQAWRTGYGPEYSTHVAAVWAEDGEEAWGRVWAIYGRAFDRLGDWVAAEPIGLRPDLCPERFPGFDPDRATTGPWGEPE